MDQILLLIFISTMGFAVLIVSLKNKIKQNPDHTDSKMLPFVSAAQKLHIKYTNEILPILNPFHSCTFQVHRLFQHTLTRTFSRAPHPTRPHAQGGFLSPPPPPTPGQRDCSTELPAAPGNTYAVITWVLYLDRSRI